MGKVRGSGSEARHTRQDVDPHRYRIVGTVDARHSHVGQEASIPGMRAPRDHETKSSSSLPEVPSYMRRSRVPPGTMADEPADPIARTRRGKGANAVGKCVGSAWIVSEIHQWTANAPHKVPFDCILARASARYPFGAERLSIRPQAIHGSLATYQ